MTRTTPPGLQLALPMALSAVLMAVAGCAPLREVAEALLDRRTPRERYEAALLTAGLGNSALVLDWTAAAQRALLEAPSVPARHVEEGVFHPAEPVALSFRVGLKRGQRFIFAVDLPSDTMATLFLDVWEVDPGGEEDDSLRRIAVADSGERSITYGARRDGEFIVRAQPELLRGGRYTASIRVDPTLAFPVKDRRESDIGSRFGDARDGGRRSHHGIDIFAPRGTAVIAASPGTVSRVQTTPVGGNVVWMRDTSGNRLYYAHLDRHHVHAGDEVNIGDTLGFVGNTGNARTTPPHLHFGVYSRGPVDPYWYLHSPRVVLPSLAADTSLLGEWARTVHNETALHGSPNRSGTPVNVLPEETPVRVVAATGSWYRVRLPDGTVGYIVAEDTEPTSEPLRAADAENHAVLAAMANFSGSSGNALAMVAPGTSLEVLGTFGELALVRNGGVSGWVRRTLISGECASGDGTESQNCQQSKLK